MIHRGFTMFSELLYTDNLSSPHKDNREKTKKFVSDFNNCAKGEYELLPNQHYINAQTALKVRHTCGNVTPITPTNLLNIGKGIIKTNCKPCALKLRDDNQRYTIEDHKKVLVSKGFPVDEFVFLSEYVNTETKLRVLHTSCSTEFEIRPREQVQGNLCKFCSNNQKSKMEKELLGFIKEMLPDTEVLENAKLLEDKRSEVDIYIPSMEMAIEFNGSWWHREEVNKGRDYKKLEELAEKNIRLVTVREHEWIAGREKVLSRLRSILGAVGTTIYARKTYVSELDSRTKSQFLEDNHLQGKDKSFLNLGLYTKGTDELVSVMTFSKPRKSMNGSDIELSRFCNILNTNVVGGFSKLLKAATKILGSGTAVRTYANLSYSLGNVYEANGFSFSHVSKPSYWYVKHSTGRVYHRFNFRKGILAELVTNGTLKYYDESLSEKANMLNNGYYTILDSGNFVYTIQL